MTQADKQKIPLFEAGFNQLTLENNLLLNYFLSDCFPVAFYGQDVNSLW